MERGASRIENRVVTVWAAVACVRVCGLEGMQLCSSVAQLGALAVSSLSWRVQLPVCTARLLVSGWASTPSG